MKLEKLYYYLYNTRFNFKWQEDFPTCDVVHLVTRKEVPLGTIKECKASRVKSD